MIQYISWSQGYFTSLHISKLILWTFIPNVNCTWQYLNMIEKYIKNVNTIDSKESIVS